MNVRTTLLVLCACLASGCATYEGSYSPSCPTYAGDTIELRNGEFTWSKYTDEVVVDEDGNKVERFPDYPIRGAYKVSGKELRMTGADGQALPVMHLYTDGGRLFLYTMDEMRALGASGERPDCPLQRQ